MNLISKSIPHVAVSPSCGGKRTPAPARVQLCRSASLNEMHQKGVGVANFEPLETLIAHDRWATQQLLIACRPLSEAQLDQPFEMGHGSLRVTIVHMLNVIQGWHAGLANAPSPADVAANATTAELEAAHERIAGAFAPFVRESMTRESMSAVRRGNKLTGPPAVIFTHILTHGTHHRAQALNMLRHLGVSPLPKSSVIEWSIATGITQLEIPK